MKDLIIVKILSGATVWNVHTLRYTSRIFPSQICILNYSPVAWHRLLIITPIVRWIALVIDAGAGGGINSIIVSCKNRNLTKVPLILLPAWGFGEAYWVKSDGTVHARKFVVFFFWGLHQEFQLVTAKDGFRTTGTLIIKLGRIVFNVPQEYL